MPQLFSEVDIVLFDGQCDNDILRRYIRLELDYRHAAPSDMASFFSFRDRYQGKIASFEIEADDQADGKLIVQMYGYYEHLTEEKSAIQFRKLLSELNQNKAIRFVECPLKPVNRPHPIAGGGN
ncbi:MAG: hypothetical protein NTV34_03110 [Proteobacteria bacterium]|nr:hypothetical protein [Pseudomonadota bacterium]